MVVYACSYRRHVILNASGISTQQPKETGYERKYPAISCPRPTSGWSGVPLNGVVELSDNG